MKKYLLIFVFLCLFVFSSCKKDKETGNNEGQDTVQPEGDNQGNQGNTGDNTGDETGDDPAEEHVCVDFEWRFEEGTNCGSVGDCFFTCIECGKVVLTDRRRKEHDLYEVVVEPKCEEDGSSTTKCHNCDYEYTVKLAATGHKNCYYVVDLEATETEYGRRHKECADCGAAFRAVEYAANGFAEHGKLSVNGTNLVDSQGKPFQLVGVSTHGLQWASQYVDYEVIEELRNNFGINVLRLALYTAEGGYCSESTTETRRQYLYNLVCQGIEICTKLNMYAIVDWHMVGADDPSDGNPLYYKTQAKEFFAKITEQYKDYDNVLYEIMNEPCGDTTWAQCKAYAEEVIPIIRENTDGIILVGNPKWSADLVSVQRNPLVGFDNIMYTYHFYANGHFNVSAITRAIDAGLPVFVSEHGGMEASGDGALDLNSLKAWYNVLESNNISYVAWNLSNTAGSASMQKHLTYDYTNFKDANLKEWGIWYKNWVRKKFGLPDE